MERTSDQSKKDHSNGSNSSKGVKAKSDAAQGLHDLFVASLKDIYWAEKALTKALPKMIENATSPELIKALTGHLEETHGHVTRVESVFKSIGVAAEAKKCEAMTGLIKEAEEIMQETVSGVVRDAGIISAGHKVEHYEIATYTTLSIFATTLGETEAASLLTQTLTEEKAADDKLTSIAQKIDVKAAALHA